MCCAMRKVAYALFLVGCFAVIGGSAFCISKITTAEAQGVWKAKDSDYYIVFEGENTYRETLYNMSCPYTLESDVLTLYDVLGRAYSTRLTDNYGGHAVISLYDETFIMSDTEMPPAFSQIDQENLPPVINTFTLKGGLSSTFSLQLCEEQVFCRVMDGVADYGKWALADDMSLILFSPDKGTEILEVTAEGYVFTRMYSDLQISVVKSNAIEPRGYLLNGTVTDSDSDTRYTFYTDNTVQREAEDGTSVAFFYFVDMNGLITLTDVAGLSVYDYLFLDIESQTIYRYVLERDSWFYFVSGIGGA